MRDKRKRQKCKFFVFFAACGWLILVLPASKLPSRGTPFRHVHPRTLTLLLFYSPLSVFSRPDEIRADEFAW